MKWRFAWMTLLLVLALCTLVPSLVSSKSLPAWFSNVFSNKVQLGLDLQGGAHLLLEVEIVTGRSGATRRAIDATCVSWAGFA